MQLYLFFLIYIHKYKAKIIIVMTLSQLRLRILLRPTNLNADDRKFCLISLFLWIQIWTSRWRNRRQLFDGVQKQKWTNSHRGSWDDLSGECGIVSKRHWCDVQQPSQESRRQRWQPGVSRDEVRYFDSPCNALQPCMRLFLRWITRGWERTGNITGFTKCDDFCDCIIL